MTRDATSNFKVIEPPAIGSVVAFRAKSGEHTKVTTPYRLALVEKWGDKGLDGQVRQVQIRFSCMPQDKVNGQIIDTIRETSTYKRLDQLILICGVNDDSLETEFAKGAKATADLLNKLMGTHPAGIQSHKRDGKETNKNMYCDLRKDHKGTESELKGIKEKEVKEKNKEYIKEVLQPGDDVQADNIYEEISDEDRLVAKVEMMDIAE